MSDPGLDQFWRCPSCGVAQAIGAPARFAEPPTCQMCKCEMEQTTAEGWNAGLSREEPA